MDQITVFDAAHILGTTPQEAKQLLGDREITLDEAETLALEHYPWKEHVDDPDSYWVTVKQAAQVLGVSVQRVKQLLDAELVPQHNANICEHCPSFHTEASSLPILAAQRVDAQALARDAEQRGWIAEAERHQQLIARLDTLIGKAEAG